MFNLSLNGPVGLPYSAGPTPFVPIAPDFGICDRRYGAHLTPLLCGWAADTLIQGKSLVPYNVHGGVPGPQTLPYTAVFGEYSLSLEPFDLSYSCWAGNCKIWIEIAGPSTPEIFEAVPNEIRGMAVWIVDQCVSGDGRGYGGFATKDISRLTTYVTKPDTKISETYRKYALHRANIQSFELNLVATPQQPRVHS